MIGSGKSARAGADDEHAFSRRLGIDPQRPSLPLGKVAQEALDGVDGDRRVERGAVTGRLARMVADPAVHGRHRVIPDQRFPRLAVLAGLRQIKPGLDVLAGRAGIVAGRQKVDIERTARPDRPCPPLAGQIDGRRHVVRLSGHHRASSSCFLYARQATLPRLDLPQCAAGRRRVDGHGRHVGAPSRRSVCLE